MFNKADGGLFDLLFGVERYSSVTIPFVCLEKIADLKIDGLKKFFKNFCNFFAIDLYTFINFYKMVN